MTYWIIDMLIPRVLGDKVFDAIMSIGGHKAFDLDGIHAAFLHNY